jgi:molybdate transport system regulatory protein
MWSLGQDPACNVFSCALQAWCDFLTRPHTHLSIRLDLNNGDRIGPGKIALLEAIQAKGSIAAAARHLGMSYRRARLLVQQINHALQQPAIVTPRGSTVVTPLGGRVINLYRSIENLTRAAAFQELQEIARLTRRRPPDRKKRARQTG